MSAASPGAGPDGVDASAREPDPIHEEEALGKAYDKLPEVALSFADFADMKSKYTRGQSRRVAELAVAMARPFLVGWPACGFSQ